jgi:hypothetical protein
VKSGAKARQHRLEARAEHYEGPDGKACGGRAKRRVRDVLKHHAGWDEDTILRAACEIVWIGMTADQLVASWGRPIDINRTTTSAGTDEQWVYGTRGFMADAYVYLENGRVTAIQN